MRWKMKKEKFWSCSFFVFVLSLAKLLTTFPRGSHCFARSLIAKMPFLCRFTKKWRKKGNPGVPPGNPLHPAGLKPHPSRLCRATLPTGEGLAKAFAVSFLFELSSDMGKEAETNVVCESRVRATPVSVFFFKTPTQNLKLLAFAPCCEIYLARNGARTRGSKGH